MARANIHQEMFDNHMRPPPALDQAWPEFLQDLDLENNEYYNL